MKAETSLKTTVSMAVVVCALLSPVGALAGTTSASSTIDRMAVVSQTGKKALVSGWLPKCRKGATRTVTVHLTQSGKTAKGAWRGRCHGPRQSWSAVLRTAGARLTPGPARVEGLVRYRSGNRQTKRTIASRVRLRTKAGDLPADRQIMVGVTFDLPVGYEVYVEGGSGEQYRSSCTRDETTERFTSDGSPKRVLFQYVAKSGGACAIATSYNNAWVNVEGPGPDRFGFFWLGQKAPGQGYFASCLTRVENAFDSYDFVNLWKGLRCEQPSDWELKVTLP